MNRFFADIGVNRAEEVLLAKEVKARDIKLAALAEKIECIFHGGTNPVCENVEFDDGISCQNCRVRAALIKELRG